MDCRWTTGFISYGFIYLKRLLTLLTIFHQRNIHRHFLIRASGQKASDYDMEGYIKKYGKPKTKEGAHLTDEFKNPSHISFSKESKYSKPGQEGGDWKYLDKSGNPLEENQPGGQWHFYASDFNLTQHTPEEMKSEFDRINKEDRKHGIPESVLHLPESGLFDKFAKNIRGTQEAIAGMNKLPGITAN